MKKQNYLYLLIIISVGFCVWFLFCQFGPGEDFFGAYRWLVLQPERYSQSYGIYSPAWLAPILAPFETMPNRMGYFVFLAVTILCVIFGAKKLGGKIVPVLVSAQMFWVLWWGQIEGLAIFGVVLGYLALETQSLTLLVLGLLFATVKPQIGLIPILAVWWWFGKELRWKAAGITALIGAATIAIWGPWPIWIVQNITKLVGHQGFNPWNISIGLAALPLFIPAFLLPLDHKKRLMALTATGLLVSPYMPYYSSIILLCMGIPWWAYIFAFIGFLPNVIGTRLAWNGIMLLPLLVLLWLYLPYLQPWMGRTIKRIKEKFSAGSKEDPAGNKPL